MEHQKHLNEDLKGYMYPLKLNMQIGQYLAKPNSLGSNLWSKVDAQMFCSFMVNENTF